MKKLLITGATGFLGENVKKYFSEESDYEIVQITRGNISKDDFITTLNYDDIFSSKERFFCYLHLAGKAHDTDYKTSRKEFFKVNVDLTKNIFDRFLEDAKSETFIFVSSIAAVCLDSVITLQEDCKPKPNGYYGESKLEAEKYILSNLPAERSNKKVYILRPPMIHGPGNKGNLNLLFNIVSKRIPWPLGKYDNKRSFLSIDNFCYIVKELIEKDIETGVYHVADDEPLSTNDIVEMISKELALKTSIWNVPKAMIQMVAKVGNYLPLPLNEKRLEKLTENLLVSNGKISEATEESLPVSARDGMQKTIKSLKKEHV
jgi:nucleoside-diphosphate-sugar epimerase